MQSVVKNEKAELICQAVRSCLPNNKTKFALHEPLFAGNEWAYVKDCLDSGWVSSVGKYVDQFEAKLQDFTQARKVIAVVNGTAALHIALKLAGVEDGHEVFLQDLSFIAPANAVSYCNAIPHFIDCNLSTLGADPIKLDAYLSEITSFENDTCINRKTGRIIKALIVVHTFGHPVELDAIKEICDRYKLVLIEDAAEAIGSKYKGKHVGTWGKFGVLSFNGNKTITTGGGGALMTNDETVGQLAKHLTTTAKISHSWLFEHDQIGYNYRLPNINAALGCAQLEQLPAFVKNKRALAKRYETAFQNFTGVSFFKEPASSESNCWLNAILLDHEDKALLNAILELLHQEGIAVRPCWKPLHKQSMFKNCPRMDLSVSASLESRIINLPSSPSL